MTVTDEDRKAAASGYFAWCSGNETIPNRMLAGRADDHSMVQAFARHRQAAYAAGLERAAVIMEGEAKTLYRIAHMNLPAYSPTVARDRAQYCEGMADAIRAEKDKT